MAYKYVFGPVRSSRLGLSLGLDLVGEAICSLDCVYCEVGRTTCLTTAREPYVPARAILDELEQWQREGHRQPEYVTLGGSGEPTLNSEMGDVIEGVRKIFPDTPVAVLTNSTLLHDESVRRDLCMADVVLPSVDTLVPEQMRHLNRPHKHSNVKNLEQGLRAFANEFDGRLYLEVLLVAGVNDNEENFTLLEQLVDELKVHRVDVVTMTRPGTLDTAKPTDPETLARWQDALGALAIGEGTATKSQSRTGETNILSSDAAPDPGMADAIHQAHAQEDATRQVGASIARRPQTAAQLEDALGLSPQAVDKALSELRSHESLSIFDSDGETFFALRESRS